jgi:hypothetical protein
MKVEAYARKPPRNVFGIDRNAITMAEANLRNLQEAQQRMAQPGAWRRSGNLTAYLAGKDRLTARRVARRDAEFMARLNAMRRRAN